MPQQIKTMWASGTLTADDVVFPSGYPDWIPISEFLQRSPSQEPTGSVSSGARPLGILLGIVGVVVLMYFMAIYDTSVRSERHYVPGLGYVGGESVVNLGKQQNRLIRVIVGIALGVSGLIVANLPSRAGDA